MKTGHQAGSGTTAEAHGRQLAKFWWVFAVRGGSAILFGLAMAYMGNLIGSMFFDPVLLIFVSMLLGFFVLGNGVLLGVAAGFAAEQRLRLGWLLLAECLFAVCLGIYLGHSLRINPHTLAWFAGLLATGDGCFQFLLAVRARSVRLNVMLLSLAGTLSLTAGVLFLLHRDATTRATAFWLSLFEVVVGSIWLVFAYGLHDRAISQSKS